MHLYWYSTFIYIHILVLSGDLSNRSPPFFLPSRTGPCLGSNTAFSCHVFLAFYNLEHFHNIFVFYNTGIFLKNTLISPHIPLLLKKLNGTFLMWVVSSWLSWDLVATSDHINGFILYKSCLLVLVCEGSRVRFLQESWEVEVVSWGSCRGESGSYFQLTASKLFTFTYVLNLLAWLFTSLFLCIYFEEVIRPFGILLVS